MQHPYFECFVYHSVQLTANFALTCIIFLEVYTKNVNLISFQWKVTEKNICISNKLEMHIIL